MAYLLLAIVIAFTFAAQRQNAKDDSARIASNTRIVLIAGCERQNVLRSTLQELILAGIPQTEKFVKEGTLTQAQANRSIVQTRIAARKLAPTDCVKTYPSLTPKK